jgi:hypothetical protein
MTDCGGACVDTMTDPGFCGDCFNSCDAGATCTGGVCDACAGTECGAFPPVCSDTNTDPNNCGMCFDNCADGEHCGGGTCTCRPGLTMCGATCVDTDHSLNNCGDCGISCTGMGLANPRCIDGACVDTTCGALGLTFCGAGFTGGTCLDAMDLATNPLHCGACNNTCNSDEVCIDGDCTDFFTSPTPGCAACGAGTTCCTYPGDTYTICVDGPTCP